MGPVAVAGSVLLPGGQGCAIAICRPQFSNVVFPTGCIERDGLYRLYYGGADKVICTCTIPRAEVEEALYAAM